MTQQVRVHMYKYKHWPRITIVPLLPSPPPHPHAHPHSLTHPHAHTHRPMHLHTYMHMCTHTLTHTHTHTHVHTHTPCTHTHAHTHLYSTHVYSLSKQRWIVHCAFVSVVVACTGAYIISSSAVEAASWSDLPGEGVLYWCGPAL